MALASPSADSCGLGWQSVNWYSGVDCEPSGGGVHAKVGEAGHVGRDLIVHRHLDGETGDGVDQCAPGHGLGWGVAGQQSDHRHPTDQAVTDAAHSGPPRSFLAAESGTAALDALHRGRFRY